MVKAAPLFQYLILLRGKQEGLRQRALGRRCPKSRSQVSGPVCSWQGLSSPRTPSSVRVHLCFTEYAVYEISIHFRTLCRGIIITKVQINNLTSQSTLDPGASNLIGV